MTSAQQALKPVSMVERRDFFATLFAGAFAL
jgi:hypothetical protein